MWTMPEVAVQRLLQLGMSELKANTDPLYDIFAFYTSDELNNDFGEAYIDKIEAWFRETKIPVIMGWALNAQRIPCVSVTLASEQEDEAKASLNDYMGMGNDYDVGGSVFTVQVDIGIHVDKSSDYVIWMYYIVSYILFKNKLLAEKLGLRLHTWSASDYNRENMFSPENIWSRWLRYKCTVQNMWKTEELTTPDEVEVDLDFESVLDDEILVEDV
jgi:hypothetical protein